MERKRKFDTLEIPPLKSVDRMDDQPCIAGRVHLTGSQVNFPISNGDLSEDRNLCTRCAELDIKTIFLDKPKTFRGKLIMNLGDATPSQLSTSCSLCQLLIAMTPKDPQIEGKKEEYGLFALPGQILDTYKGMVDTVLLGVLRLADFRMGNSKRRIQISLESTGLIGKFDSLDSATGFRLRSLQSASLDFDILRTWLNLCVGFHTKICGKPSKTPMHRLKVIHCNERKVIPAPSGCRYLTLSYLWGPSRDSESQDSDDLTGRLPTTIEDAITVTRKLGFTYLWVDRYCICQDDEIDKHHQIAHMDIIYQNSEATIIDAAGVNPWHGLPGVSCTPRYPQPKARIGDHVLISTLPDPRQVIKSSKWMTRGWTYQEALLSRRRLVFTDHQVYYECYGMHCYEVIDFPVLDLHIKSLQRFRRNHAGIFPEGVGKHPWDMLARISEYSTRSFSYPSDALNGALGVLRAFEDLEYPLTHYFGVPILSRYLKSIGGSVAAKKRPSDNGLAVGLCWSLERPGKRRMGFPSWSWAGWSGKVWPQAPDYENDTISEGSELSVSIELANGDVLKWEEFQQSGRKYDIPSLSPFIHITAKTISVRFKLRGHYQDGLDSCLDRCDPHMYAVFNTVDGWKSYGHWRPNLLIDDESIRTRLLWTTYTGICITSSQNTAVPSPFILVVALENDIMERIGTVHLCNNSSYPEITYKTQSIRLG